MDPHLRSRAGIAALERVATSTTLDCALSLLMSHYHSKATISFLTLDMVSPYVTQAEVRNLHAWWLLLHAPVGRIPMGHKP